MDPIHFILHPSCVHVTHSPPWHMQLKDGKDGQSRRKCSFYTFRSSPRCHRDCCSNGIHSASHVWLFCLRYLFQQTQIALLSKRIQENQDSTNLAVNIQRYTLPRILDETTIKMLTTSAFQLYQQLQKVCKEIEEGGGEITSSQQKSSVSLYDNNNVHQSEVFGAQFDKKPSYIVARNHACDLHKRLESLSNEFKELQS